MKTRDELFHHVFYELSMQNVLIHQCAKAGSALRQPRDITLAHMVIALEKQNAELLRQLMDESSARPPVVIQMKQGGAA